MSVNLENSAVATELEKMRFIPIPKKGNAKECSNYCTIVLISHTSKDVNMVNSRKSRFQTRLAEVVYRPGVVGGEL